MKKISTFFMFLFLVGAAYGQSEITAQIAGYKLNDTIKIDELIKSGELIPADKSEIVSFTLLFTYNGSDYKFFSKSGKMTEEMKKALSWIKPAKNEIRIIIFKDITIETENKERNIIEPLICRVRM
jgi:hypothetical protein